MTDFLGFTSPLDGFFAFWGGVSYFSKFPKLLISRHVAFVEVRLRGGGRGWLHNYGSGVLLSVLGANLKFRKIVVQLYAMHGKF